MMSRQEEEHNVSDDVKGDVEDAEEDKEEAEEEDQSDIFKEEIWNRKICVQVKVNIRDILLGRRKVLFWR